ncbi:MAG: alpha/beta hydrolase [Fervidobacterium sp.]
MKSEKKSSSTSSRSRSTRPILILKIILYIFSLIIAVFNFAVFLIIFVLINIPLIRKSVFGKLALDPRKKTWERVESNEYADKKKLDIFFPNLEQLRLESPKGVVLFAHGGGWISGYRRQPNNVSWYRYLVGKGFIVATIDYSRGYKAGIEKLIDELLEAVEYLSKRLEALGIDKQISLIGLSAGAHLALLSASRIPDKIKCVVSYYAPCDLMDIWKTPSLFARFSAITTLKRLPGRSKEIYEKYSPINNVSPDFPPTLLVHGLKDQMVSYTSAVKMFKALSQVGVKVKLLLHPYGDHGFEFVLKDNYAVRILEKTADFLEGNLW